MKEIDWIKFSDRIPNTLDKDEQIIVAIRDDEDTISYDIETVREALDNVSSQYYANEYVAWMRIPAVKLQKYREVQGLIIPANLDGYLKENKVVESQEVIAKLPYFQGNNFFKDNLKGDIIIDNKIKRYYNTNREDINGKTIYFIAVPGDCILFIDYDNITKEEVLKQYLQLQLNIISNSLNSYDQLKDQELARQNYLQSMLKQLDNE